jgi:hypothetical protein
MARHLPRQLHTGMTGTDPDTSSNRFAPHDAPHLRPNSSVSTINWQHADACAACADRECLFRLPHPPEESLLLGSALAMRRKDHHRSLRAWACQLGGVYAIRIGLQHVRACRRHMSCMPCRQPCSHSRIKSCLPPAQSSPIGRPLASSYREAWSLWLPAPLRPCC